MWQEVGIGLEPIDEEVREVFREEVLEFGSALRKANTSLTIVKLFRGFKTACEFVGAKDFATHTDQVLLVASHGSAISEELVSAVNDYLARLWTMKGILDASSDPRFNGAPPKISVRQNDLSSRPWWRFW